MDDTGNGIITLEEARKDLWTRIDGGSICPCCDKYARRYRRPFNSAMAKSLCWLVREYMENVGIDGWVHVPSQAPKWLTRTNQLPTVRWWALAEREKDTPESGGKHSGCWRPTPIGIAFTRDKLPIPERCITYNGVVESYEGPYVYMTELQDKHFDYREVMGIGK